MSMFIPNELAALGATQLAVEYYLKHKLLYSGRYSQTIFAYRYFNDEDREVGYQLPDIGNNIHTFEEPRMWWSEFLTNLTWRIEVNEH